MPKNKTNTIPIKGTVVETILKEFDKYRYHHDACDIFNGLKCDCLNDVVSFDGARAFLSSALRQVQEETREEIEEGISHLYTKYPELRTAMHSVLYQEKLKEKKSRDPSDDAICTLHGREGCFHELEEKK